MLSRALVHIACLLVLAGWIGSELLALVSSHLPGELVRPSQSVVPEVPPNLRSKDEDRAGGVTDEACGPTSVDLWTSVNVADWLENIGLGHAKAQFSTQVVGGDTLRQISRWKISNLELSIKMASQELGLAKLGDVGKFFAELDKLDL